MAFLSPTTTTRILALFLALFLGYPFVLGPIKQVRKDHWLVKDGQQSMAVVTKEHWSGHNIVVYEYRVGDKVYTGQDHRSFDTPKYAHVMPGQKTVIYFSSSHPWLSAIDLPRTVGIGGLPVATLVWVFEISLVLTVINPKSRWALDFNGQRRPLAEKEESNSCAENTIAAAEASPSNRSKQFPQSVSRRQSKDLLRLIGCAVFLVVIMFAIEIVIDLLWGR